MASTRTCSPVNWSVSGGSACSITPLTTWKCVWANGSLPAETGRRGKVDLNAATKVRLGSSRTSGTIADTQRQFSVFKSGLLAMKVRRAPGYGVHLREVEGSTFGLLETPRSRHL